MSIQKINAVHSEDIETYLTALGVLDLVVDGKRQCEICGKKITLGNIACLYPKDGEVAFVCDDSVCVDTVIKQRSYQDD